MSLYTCIHTHTHLWVMWYQLDPQRSCRLMLSHVNSQPCVLPTAVKSLTQGSSELSQLAVFQICFHILFWKNLMLSVTRLEEDNSSNHNPWSLRLNNSCYGNECKDTWARVQNAGVVGKKAEWNLQACFCNRIKTSACCYKIIITVKAIYFLKELLKL